MVREVDLYVIGENPLHVAKGGAVQEEVQVRGKGFGKRGATRAVKRSSRALSELGSAIPSAYEQCV